MLSEKQAAKIIKKIPCIFIEDNTIIHKELPLENGKWHLEYNKNKNDNEIVIDYGAITLKYERSNSDIEGYRYVAKGKIPLCYRIEKRFPLGHWGGE